MKKDKVIKYLKENDKDLMIFLTREGSDFNAEKIFDIHIVTQGAFFVAKTGVVEVVCAAIDSHEPNNSELVDIVTECEYGKFSKSFAEVISKYDPKSILLAYSDNPKYDSLYQGLYETSFAEVDEKYQDCLSSAQDLLQYALTN